MLDSLSQKINLKVNGFQIILNQELNESELKSHKFKKAGFFDRLMVKPERNEVVFWSKNCELTYLKEDFGDVIFPILDAKAGAAIMYGTSSYLRYKQNNLSKFVFQIIQNKMAAQKHIEEFEQKLIESIGKSSSANGAFTIWEMKKLWCQILNCELHSSLFTIQDLTPIFGSPMHSSSKLTATCNMYGAVRSRSSNSGLRFSLPGQCLCLGLPTKGKRYSFCPSRPGGVPR